MGAFRIGAWVLVCSLGSCAQQTEESSPRHRTTGGSAGALGSSAGSTGSGASGDTASGGAAGSATAGTAGTDPGASGGAGCAGTSATCGDACPDDPLKTAPGACGCGEPEADSDVDGVANCADECPQDPERTKLGPCGCDANPADEPKCTALKSALKHRYSFDESGVNAPDSIGGENATLVNATVTGGGFVKLSGSDAYVDLPNGIISALTSVTLETWISWSGGGNWQRIFDFGDDSTGVEGSRGTGGGYLFLSPKGDTDFMRAAYRKKDQAEVRLDIAPALAIGERSHLALVVDDATDEMRLYLNGVLKGSVALAENVSTLHDVNNWLGRSQFQNDGGLRGELHEFRIYGEVLSAALVKFSFDAGPDAAFLSK